MSVKVAPLQFFGLVRPPPFQRARDLPTPVTIFPPRTIKPFPAMSSGVGVLHFLPGRRGEYNSQSPFESLEQAIFCLMRLELLLWNF